MVSRYYGHNTTRALCAGAGAGPSLATPPATSLRCSWLHHAVPYTRLGPFKYVLIQFRSINILHASRYEPLSGGPGPHVAMFRDFMSPGECDAVLAR